MRKKKLAGNSLLFYSPFFYRAGNGAVYLDEQGATLPAYTLSTPMHTFNDRVPQYCATGLNIWTNRVSLFQPLYAVIHYTDSLC